MSGLPSRNPDLISRHASQLLVIDVQEKLIPSMQDGASVIKNTGRLVQAARLLEVPVVVTEQYPRGLGPTSEELTIQDARRFEKQRFSAVEAFTDKDPVAEQMVLCGMETHICVLQTALDLLALGSSVFVVSDAVTSRRSEACRVALQRMRDHGVAVVTTESVLFEWLETAEHPEFRAVQALIR